MTAAPPARELPRRVQAATGTHRGLPRRVRQASLAPQLAGHGPERRAFQCRLAADTTARSPEENRDLMSALQQGWQRGRLDDLDELDDGLDKWPGRRPARGAASDGEAP